MRAQQIKQGLLGFANESVLPKLPPQQQFVTGMALGLLTGKADTIIENLATMPAVKLLGIIDEDGDVDVASLYASAKDQIHRSGTLVIDLPMIGKMTFMESDLDGLYNHLIQCG